MEPLEPHFNKVRVEGAMGSNARVQRFCVNLLNEEPGLKTFAAHRGVEPTNNFMERLLRRVVL